VLPTLPAVPSVPTLPATPPATTGASSLAQATAHAVPVAHATGVTPGRGVSSAPTAHGTGLASSVKGRTITIRFWGTGIDLHFVAARNAGKVKISIDGKARVVDLWSPRTRDLLRTIAGLTTGSHVVVVTVLGIHGPRATGSRVVLGTMQVRGPRAV